MIDILDLKLQDKFSTLGTTKLTGNIGSKITAEIDFIIHWEAVDIDIELVANTNILNSNDGTDFIQKGFKLGDSFELVGTASNDGSYEIIGITQYTLFVGDIDSGSMSGSAPGTVSFVEELSVVASLHGTTPVNTIDYYFGLVPNGANAAYTSLIDSEVQHYRKTGLDADAGNTYDLDVFTVNKSWVTSSTTEQAGTEIEEMGIGTSGASYGYEQRFKITHVFHISPAVLKAWEDAGGDLDITLISFLYQNASLKFIPRITSGFSPSGSEHSTDNGNLSTFLQDGDVGFYDEYRNGGAPKYAIDTAVTYESSNNVSTNNLATNDTVTFEIIIESLIGNFNTDHRFDVYVFVVPADAADYQNNVNTVWTNFDVSNVFMSEAGGVASDNHIVNADVISLSPTTVNISVPYQGAASMAGKKYLIFVDVGELGADTANNNHHTLMIDYNSFSLFIDTTDLIITPGLQINEHSSNDLNKASTDFKGWIEDALLATMYVDIKKTAGVLNEFSADISSLTYSIDVEHDTDSTRDFNLEEIEIPVNTNSDRGFQLYSGDPKNYKVFSELVPTATYNKYLLQIATKLRWETWALQGNADPDFINATANWSTFDTTDWKIYININIVVALASSTDEETFTYTQKTPIKIHNYDEFNGCNREGDIETYHPDTGNSLNGKLLFHKNTVVKGIFTGKSLFPCIYRQGNSGSGSCSYSQLDSGSGSYSNGEGEIVRCPDYYGILELDIQGAGNQQSIRQISTVWDTETNSPWVGEVLTNKAKITMFPFELPEPYIIVEAVLDYTQLNTSLTYKLSARLGRIAQTICDVSIMGVAESGNTITNSGLSGFTLDEILVFNAQEELTSDPASTMIGDTFSANRDLTGGYKICCSKDAIIAVASPSGEYTDAALIGLSLNDFLVFNGNNGREMTTQSILTFNSGTGTIGGMPAGVDIKISLHDAMFISALISQNSFVASVVNGYSELDVMILINGREVTHIGATISGSTVTLPATVSGAVKICLVNQ